MATAAQEPKADTRAAFNVNPFDEFDFANFYPERSTLVILGNAVDERSLGRLEQILKMQSSMENTTFMWNASPDEHVIGGSPYAKDPSCNGTPIGHYPNAVIKASNFSPIDGDAIPFFLPSAKKRDVELERVIAAFDNRKLSLKRIEEFNKLRLASFASSSTNPGGLLLDSGASIHAVGEARLLTGIELFSIDKWAVLPDDTRLRIVGTGTMQTDRFSIPKVHLVDGLKKNLISVSQLDKDHGLCCCFHSKKCELILADGTVVGGAILQDDGMYELYFLEVPAEPEE